MNDNPRDVAIAFIVGVGLTALVAVGLASKAEGGSSPVPSCVVHSLSLNQEKPVENGGPQSWLYDNTTTYLGECRGVSGFGS